MPDPVGSAALRPKGALGSAAALSAVAWVAVGGVIIGVLTSIGQGVLPDVLAPMANSAGSWCLAVFALAAFAMGSTNRPAWLGAVLGALALFAMVIGYALASEVSGYAAGTRLVLFWGAAAVVVGPAVGIAAAWFRGGGSSRAAVAAGVIAGILAGEAIYGLTFIAATTPVVYWAGQLVIGVGVAMFAAAFRLDSRERLLCLLVLLVTGAAVLAAYATNPIQYLTA